MRSLRAVVFGAVLLWCAVQLLELVASLLHRYWTPAELAGLDGPATAWALASVRDDPRWCRAVLRAQGTRFTAMPDRVTGPGCGFTGTVRLDEPVWSPRRPVVTCPVAVALGIWERRSLRPAAAARGRQLTAIEHYGSYSCRTIAGSARQSQHATANAIDIAGLRFAKGPAVRVRTDWNRGSGGALLTRAHADACRLFGTVLGPGYNAAHRDHLHLDNANWRYCP